MLTRHQQIRYGIAENCPAADGENVFFVHSAQRVRCTGRKLHGNQRRDRPRHIVPLLNRVGDGIQFHQFDAVIRKSIEIDENVDCDFVLIAPITGIGNFPNLPIRIILLGSLKKIRFRQHFRQRQGFGKRRQARAAHQQGKKTS